MIIIIVRPFITSSVVYSDIIVDSNNDYRVHILFIHTKNKYYGLLLLELSVLTFPTLPKELVPTAPEVEETRPPPVFPPPTVEPPPPTVPAED